MESGTRAGPTPGTLPCLSPFRPTLAPGQVRRPRCLHQSTSPGPKLRARTAQPYGPARDAVAQRPLAVLWRSLIGLKQSSPHPLGPPMGGGGGVPERRVGAPVVPSACSALRPPLPPRSPLPPPRQSGLARPRGAPRTVRLPLLALPAGSSPLAEIPASGARVPKQSVLETPGGWGGGGALRVAAGLGRALWHPSWGDARPRGRGDRQLV